MGRPHIAQNALCTQSEGDNEVAMGVANGHENTCGAMWFAVQWDFRMVGYDSTLFDPGAGFAQGRCRSGVSRLKHLAPLIARRHAHVCRCVRMYRFRWLRELATCPKNTCAELAGLPPLLPTLWPAPPQKHMCVDAFRFDAL